MGGINGDPELCHAYKTEGLGRENGRTPSKDSGRMPRLPRRYPCGSPRANARRGLKGGTGEPGASKAACPVRWEAVGKGRHKLDLAGGPPDENASAAMDEVLRAADATWSTSSSPRCGYGDPRVGQREVVKCSIRGGRHPDRPPRTGARRSHSSLRPHPGEDTWPGPFGAKIESELSN